MIGLTEYLLWSRKHWKCTDNSTWNKLHAATGMGSELGELNDLFKKWLFHGQPLTREQVIDELGDLTYYLVRMMDEWDIKPQHVLLCNKVKLDSRAEFGKDKEREKQLQLEILYPDVPDRSQVKS